MGADAVREETTVTGDWGAADATARRTDNGSMVGEVVAAGSGVRTKLARSSSEVPDHKGWLLSEKDSERRRRGVEMSRCREVAGGALSKADPIQVCSHV